jgi:predicted solute-binding protein
MGEGSGFDDLLRSLGQDALVAEVEAALTAAEAAALALEQPVDAALTAGDPALTALYEAMVELGRLWKEDVATALVMTVPAEAAGDND